jgi:hypothetical protein
MENTALIRQLKKNSSGLAYSPLPKLVHAHARHILVNPTPHRPGGINLLPHQLITNKMVGFDFPTILFFPFQPLQPSP